VKIFAPSKNIHRSNVQRKIWARDRRAEEVQAESKFGEDVTIHERAVFGGEMVEKRTLGICGWTRDGTRAATKKYGLKNKKMRQIYKKMKLKKTVTSVRKKNLYFQNM
jgi:hypothetical protein